MNPGTRSNESRDLPQMLKNTFYKSGYVCGVMYAFVSICQEQISLI